ncbi:bifunctional folylpolyglutamate synthase/dihydrofolate synthase [Akkermansiaceae bacterium]|nr:bifunctional folylpolyglutamate synthase/dihydrofolate synthase [Akkermansiaceae bacterium]
MNYREAIDWLYSTQLFGIKLGLEAPRRLLRDFLAYPKHGTKVIHVAGTNGKGSTCAMIDALGKNLALRTGLFTSPHLIDYRERVRVSGIDITEERCAQLLTELKDLVADWDHHPTFFELTLALAMRHFRESACELIILETGMGGRLDATTAVPADVCVITPVALDHTQWLGSTLTEVASEKGGIVVKGKPLLSAKQKPEAQLELERCANQAQAPLTFINEPLLGYPIGIPGQHQKENAALACEAMISAGYYLSYDVVLHSLSKLRWPGRFEVLESIPFGHQAPFVLDAAHNPHAAEALVATWKERFGEKKAQVIFGAADDKEVQTVLKVISEITEHFHLVPVKSPRSLEVKALSELVTLTEFTAYSTLENALNSTADNNAHTLLTGSLFLIGELKGILNNKSTRSSSQ